MKTAEVAFKMAASADAGRADRNILAAFGYGERDNDGESIYKGADSDWQGGSSSESDPDDDVDADATGNPSLS